MLEELRGLKALRSLYLGAFWIKIKVLISFGCKILCAYNVEVRRVINKGLGWYIGNRSIASKNN